MSLEVTFLGFLTNHESPYQPRSLLQYLPKEKPTRRGWSTMRRFAWLFQAYGFTLNFCGERSPLSLDLKSHNGPTSVVAPSIDVQPGPP